MEKKLYIVPVVDEVELNATTICASPGNGFGHPNTKDNDPFSPAPLRRIGNLRSSYK